MRTLLIGIGVAIVGAAVVVLVLARGGGEPAGDAPLSAYTITYDVEQRVGEVVERTTQVVEAQRPFRARRRTFAGSPGAGAPVRVEVRTESGLYLSRPADDGTDPQLHLVEALPPGVPSFDLRLTTSLSLAVERGDVVVDGEGERLGRACRWYVTRDPLDAGRWEPGEPGDEVHSCVDGDGLLLEERFVIAGQPARTRVATALELTATLTDAELFGERRPDDEDGARVRTVAHDQPIDERLAVEAPAPPAGFTLAHVTAYTALDPLSGFARPAAIGEVLSYRRGPDLMTLESVRTLTAAPGSAEPGGDVIDIGELGDGRLELTSTGPVLEVVAPSGASVVLRGTVSVDELAAWARTLVPTAA